MSVRRGRFTFDKTILKEVSINGFKNECNRFSELQYHTLDDYKNIEKLHIKNRMYSFNKHEK